MNDGWQWPWQPWQWHLVDSVDRMTEKYFLVSCFFAVFRMIPMMIPMMIHCLFLLCEIKDESDDP